MADFISISTGTVKLTYSVPSEIVNQVDREIGEIIRSRLNDLKKAEILERPENKAEIEEAAATIGLIAAKDENGVSILAVESK